MCSIERRRGAPIWLTSSRGGRVWSVPAIKEKKLKSAIGAQTQGERGIEEAAACRSGTPEGQPQTRGAGRREGEEAAARFLQRNGYTILERNWTCFAGEADIIAVNDEALVFVEVKTRRDADKGLPSEAVTRAKREKYERIALAYIQDHFFGEAVVRFDVVAIIVLSDDRAFIRHHLGAYSAG